MIVGSHELIDGLLSAYMQDNSTPIYDSCVSMTPWPLYASQPLSTPSLQSEHHVEGPLQISRQVT